MDSGNFMHVLVSASAGVAASPVRCLKVLGHVVGGLECVVFCGVAIPADAVVAAFISFSVGDDLVDGVLSGYRRC